MRIAAPHPLPAALLVLATVAAGNPARAGTVVVDTALRTVETSKLYVQFDQNIPDMVIQILYKDFSPIQNLTAYYGDASEFWGQSLRNTGTTGFTQYYQLSPGQWTVTKLTSTLAELTTISQSTGQPVVTTRYRFFADQPWFTVDRTIGFGAVPDTGAYQPYLARMAFFSPYHAVRWRDTHGAIQQRGFCATPCLESGWNGHWLEQLAHVGAQGARGVSATCFYPATTVPGTTIVDGYGPNTQTGWLAPQVHAGPHTTNATSSLMVGFSTAPENYAALDSMWTAYDNGGFFAGVSEDATPAALRLEVAPNPARAATTIAWTTPESGAWALDVLDVAGRRVARLGAGWSAPGPHAVTWDGRDDAGAAVAPGLYFVRLASPGGSRTARLVRAS